jgi:uncharacterized protein (DUF1778 family)
MRSHAHMTIPEKSERLEARISSEQKSIFQRAAELSGRSLTNFAINELLNAAKRIIQEHDIIQLSARDQQTFVQALLEPPKPSKSLIKAARRYKKDIKING